MTAMLMNLLAFLIKTFFWAGSFLLGWLSWLTRPTHWLLLLGVLVLATPFPVFAGWLWGPDPKVEAANQALERAAEIATEAARTQSSQQSQFLQAVETLSGERTQLAGHLKNLSDMAKRDSAWAAALSTTGPVLVSVAVLGVAGLAIWLTTRAGSHDAQLASVLVDELAGTGPSMLLLSGPSQRHVLGLGYSRERGCVPDSDPDSDSDPEEEVPF